MLLKVLKNRRNMWWAISGKCWVGAKNCLNVEKMLDLSK